MYRNERDLVCIREYIVGLIENNKSESDGWLMLHFFCSKEIAELEQEVHLEEVY